MADKKLYLGGTAPAEMAEGDVHFDGETTTKKVGGEVKVVSGPGPVVAETENARLLFLVYRGDPNLQFGGEPGVPVGPAGDAYIDGGGYVYYSDGERFHKSVLSIGGWGSLKVGASFMLLDGLVGGVEDLDPRGAFYVATVDLIALAMEAAGA